MATEIYAKECIEWWKSQEGYEAGANKSNKYYDVLDSVNFYNYKKNNQGINWCTGFYDAGIYENVSDKNVDFARSVVCEPNVDNCGAGCKQKVDYYKSKGRWIDAKDASKAQSGDEIFYWSKSYISKSNPYGVYHTGAIVDWSDEKKKFYVMEGNTGGGNGKVALKEVPYGASKILGFGHPFWTGWKRPKEETPNQDAVIDPEPIENPVADLKPEPIAPEPSTKPSKSIDELAKEVIEGKWGNGKERAQRLTEAGYSYQAVQDRVNEMLGIKKPASSSAPAPSGKYIVSISDPKSYLRIRCGAGLNYPEIGKLKKDDEVIVYETKNGFGRIGTSKWASMEFLKKA